MSYFSGKLHRVQERDAAALGRGRRGSSSLEPLQRELGSQGAVHLRLSERESGKGGTGLFLSCAAQGRRADWNRVSRRSPSGGRPRPRPGAVALCACADACAAAFMSAGSARPWLCGCCAARRGQRVRGGRRAGEARLCRRGAPRPRRVFLTQGSWERGAVTGRDCRRRGC